MWAWGAALVAALAHLTTVFRGGKGPLKVVPALLLALSVAPVSGVAAAAFLACAAGDAFLLEKTRFFLHGLGAFLVGHVLLIAALWQRGTGSAPEAVAVALTAVLLPAAAGLGWRTKGVLRVAIPLYVTALGGMALAASTLSPLAVTGAASFLISDGVLAFNRFVRPLAIAEPVVMTTYYGALFLLAAALR
ncbi:MAG: lysoplasmalogenase [Myxococcales bacterium]|nr:lysoplasmalogenase [Myxococcales bacterium]